MGCRLTKNLMLAEFACKDKCGFGTVVSDVDKDLYEGIQLMRDIAQRPVIITSGCRCPDHNKKVGGVAGSQHCLGKAADIKILGLAVAQMKTLALQVPQFANGGIGTYSTWLHVDTGPKRHFKGKN